MGDPRGFLKVRRQIAGYRPVEERLRDYNEIELDLTVEDRKLQASRCMDCGIPFCQWACPVANIMPVWQDLLYRGDWVGAYNILQSTNNFPEFTGRVCPGLCEASCVLSINDEAVTIRKNELSVIENAFESGFVIPEEPKIRTGKKVAVIGSGPAGLACADSLNKAGHTVTLFEADDKVGGYLRYGIPDFKLGKQIINRRVEVLLKEGLKIQTNTKVGKDIPYEKILEEFDAVSITIGARKPRDLNIEGRGLKGIHFALEYLTQQNKIYAGEKIEESELIHAVSKKILVIGGGDTGADCIGTANRQNAAEVTQIEILPQPPTRRTENEPWPVWPKLLRVSSSHEEGGTRMWNISTKKFVGENGHVKKVIAAKVEWKNDEDGNVKMYEIPNSEFEIETDLVLLAMGFVHNEHEGLVTDLKLDLDSRGNIKANDRFRTNIDKVFTAGDARRGASLVVWAIKEGREAAKAIDEYLKGVIQD